MKAVRLNSADSSRSSQSFGPVTRKMLHERTCEIARLAGRTAPYVTQNDYEQAKRELTGDPYALIMDTTIDASLPPPVHARYHDRSIAVESSLALTEQRLSRGPYPSLFFDGTRPLSGTT